jgi:hypothetical protein
MHDVGAGRNLEGGGHAVVSRDRLVREEVRARPVARAQRVHDRPSPALCARLGFGSGALVGPLQPLLERPGVTDILVNGPGDVWVGGAAPTVLIGVAKRGLRLPVSSEPP